MIDKVLYGAFLMYLLFACGTDYYVDMEQDINIEEELEQEETEDKLREKIKKLKKKLRKCRGKLNEQG